MGSSAPVALAPGASYGPAKRWPLSRFAELGRSLVAAGERVVVIGGSGETALGAEVAGTGVLDLTGKTTLLEVVAVLSRCAALITNDSGALHLGRAAGTRIVAVFGSSSPVWTGPEPEEGTTLWLGLPCSPCFKRECPLPGDERLRCLEDIRVSTVLDVLEQRVLSA
jgi:heptosyltransferase-2